jgi:hypothetical protein
MTNKAKDSVESLSVQLRKATAAVEAAKTALKRLRKIAEEDPAQNEIQRDREIELMKELEKLEAQHAKLLKTLDRS